MVGTRGFALSQIRESAKHLLLVNNILDLTRLPDMRGAEVMRTAVLDALERLLADEPLKSRFSERGSRPAGTPRGHRFGQPGRGRGGCDHRQLQRASGLAECRNRVVR